ncbi:MAG: DNA translocase FtsK 4TM domain-containing protein [Planctomycetes bacterium]|nr:DNA translocase FtsK 4TM domain-containing protein [Planctomycetota bacterium]
MTGKAMKRRRVLTADPVEKTGAARAAGWVVLLGVWAFTTMSLIGFDPGDAPGSLVSPVNDPTLNWCGPVGAHVAYWLIEALGVGVLVMVLGGAAYLGVSVSRRSITHLGIRAIGILLLAVSAGSLQSIVLPNSGPIPGLAGGLIGDAGATALSVRFGALGASLWLLLLAAIGAIVAFDRWLILGPRWVFARSAPAAVAVGSAAGATARVGSGLVSGLTTMVRDRTPLRVRIDDIEDDRQLRREIEAKPTGSRASRKARRKSVEPADDLEAAEPIEEEDAEAYQESDEDAAGGLRVFTPEELRAKIAHLPVVFTKDSRRVATDADLRDLQNVVDMEGYRFPGLDLLEQPEENFSATLEELVREQAEALERALRQYRIKGEVVGIESGPVITLYDVRLAPGTKVSQVTAVSSDIARALKAVNIRIVPNQVGRDTVGVEVPNPTKEKVRLKELMSRSEVSKKMKLPMFLGKDASGEPLITDLTRMPHMLIAGTTGSGKSVCMSTIIMGFMYTKKPNELKLVLVDPKMVEMSQFKSIPHLMCPVVTEMTKAAAILEWACRKMDERYELLAEAGCRDIAAYNDLEWEDLRERFDPQSPEEEALIPRTLPYMVFIIDELADIMMTVKEAENSIIRIAQKARAVGIHLILATQRPQANVVTGLIKSNMPCRICFKVSSGMDSRIVLDQKGGELLLGQGDMLYLSPHSHKLIRAQGTLVDDPEIRRVVRFMREVASPSFERQLMQLRAGTPDDDRILASENNSSASLQAAQEDAMFNRAVEIVIETGRGSVSLLQRRLAIGYTRASRLIDLMGIAGIIGEHKGSVAREVLIGAEMWSAMQEQAASDAAEGRLPGQEGAGEGVNVGAPSVDDVADDLEEIDDAEDADDDEEDSEALAEFDSEEEDEEDDEEEDEEEESDEVEYEEAAEYEDEYEDELEEDDAEPVRKPER